MSLDLFCGDAGAKPRAFSRVNAATTFLEPRKPLPFHCSPGHRSGNDTFEERPQRGESVRCDSSFALCPHTLTECIKGDYSTPWNLEYCTVFLNGLQASLGEWSRLASSSRFDSSTLYAVDGPPHYTTAIIGERSSWPFLTLNVPPLIPTI